MDFKDFFSHNSSDYLQYRPQYPAQLFDFIMNQSYNNDLAVDVGCGNGQATIELGNRFRSVIGFDPSRSQIEQAISHPKVEYRIGKAENLHLDDHSVDLLTVAQAIHWFNVDLFLKEVKRVVKPNGLLAFWTYQKPIFEGDIIDCISNFYEIIQPFWPEDRKFVDEGYESINPPFQQIVSPIFYIERDFSLDLLLNYFATWSAVKNANLVKGEGFIKRQNELIINSWQKINTLNHKGISKVLLKLYRIN